jgi:hypothetical protein
MILMLSIGQQKLARKANSRGNPRGPKLQAFARLNNQPHISQLEDKMIGCKGKNMGKP